MLLKEIVEETTMGELEANIVKMMDYNDNFILPLEKPVWWGWLTESKQQWVSGAHIGLVMWVHIQADQS